MKTLTVLAVVLALGMILGGKHRSMRAVYGLLIGACLGFLLGTGYFFLRPFFEVQSTTALGGYGQALYAIDWLAVCFVAGAFAIAAAACGFFLQGAPSKEVDTFGTLDAFCGLFNFWRR